MPSLVTPIRDKVNFCRIANATEGDSGVYACIVGTAEEHVRSVAHLAVQEDAEYIATSVARDGRRTLFNQKF